MNTFTKLAVLSAAIGGVALPDESRASIYTFVNIVDTSMAAPTGMYDETSFSYLPSISGNNVAFLVEYFDPSRRTGIFVGSGGPLTTIVLQGDPAPPGGTFGDLAASATEGPTISGNTVAFSGPFGGLGDNGVFTGSGGSLTTIVKSGDLAPAGTFNLNGLGNPATSGGTLSFYGGFDLTEAAIFTASGGSLAPAISSGDLAPTGTFEDFGASAISGSTVAFLGQFDSSNEGIFAIGGGTLSTIALVGGPAPIGSFHSLFGPVIDGIEVAFYGEYDDGIDGGKGIFTGNGGPLTTIAKTGDPAPSGVFDLFLSPSISGGVVAFTGRWNDMGERNGIFLGSGGPLETVVQNGDPLFGSIVTHVASGRFALDPDGSGNLAFAYALEDGRTGFAMATPVADDGGGVPELSSVVVWGILIALGVSAARRNPLTDRVGLPKN
jgi:hypothetical protein